MKLQSKISPLWAILIVSGVGIVVLAVSVFMAFNTQMPRQQSTIVAPLIVPIATYDVVNEASARSGLPRRIRIPRIGVDAAVEYVGITPEGAMDTPKSPAVAAWFTLGPRPGEEGSSVISGHYGWKDNLRAVFDNLHTLKKGDTIVVEDEFGSSTAFGVKELRLYGEHDDAGEVFSSQDGKAHLNLITCEGVWDPVSKSYSKRLVVLSERVREQ